MIPSGELKIAIVNTYKEYEHMEECATKAVIRHTGIAGAAGLVPFPAVDMGIFVVNLFVMFGMINKHLGVKTLSRNFLKVIASYVAANIVTSLGAAGAVLVGGKLLSIGLKFFPVLGTLPGVVVDASINATITMVAGFTYMGALTALTRKGVEINEDNVKEALAEQFADKKKMKETYKDARTAVKDMDFQAYKKEAEEFVEEHQNEAT